MTRHPGPVGRLFAWGYDRAMAGPERALVGRERQQLLAAARGRVLDVGAGTGANLGHYRQDRISALVLVDPSAAMLERARRKAARLGIEVRAEQQRAERLGCADQSFDTVVFTLSLCTIGSPLEALAEARRVLRPGGRLLVFEHVRAADPALARWQDRLTPLWSHFSGGGQLNRDTRSAIETTGFTFDTVAESRDRRMGLPVVQLLLAGIARPGRTPTASRPGAPAA